MEIRELTPDDWEGEAALAEEAFGAPPAGSPPRTRPAEPPPGRHGWGALDGGRLVAKVVALEQASWWGGVELATCGIAGVAVAAEHRSGGLLAAVMAPLLAQAAARGEVLSTLYPTAPGIYRSLGWELVAALDRVTLPTALLSRVRPPTGVTTRRAEVGDVRAVQGLYAAWAAAQNGPLTRTGPRFDRPDAELHADRGATTLAVDAAGRVVGYASWSRHGGYGPDGVLEVHDLLAVSADGYRALWQVLASSASVAPTLALRTSGADPARLLLPGVTWSPDPAAHHPYMLRVHDVAGALTARRLALPAGPDPRGGTGDGAAGSGVAIDLAVAGDRLGADGRYRLTLGDGPGRCERLATGGVAGGAPGGVDVPTLTPQGLALLFAGVQTCANLRMLDHLTGPDHHDTLLDLLLAGRPLHVRDYF
ncbi:GNAT family N-acetyltransferase [Nocardioides sp. Leaf285]|uniref:GNAT family N-acetyltransferase n=1 Tax=Nocardioides sp. Leaf285 TaxID=1736322 RepID=UPI000702BABB|nr:GNAT family N-acetyltransferase [Nocardioides sp. Leaf285]KQP66545.1 hypothetical protein ASF47_01790 [Nocardioides sp. Leaf285]